MFTRNNVILYISLLIAMILGELKCYMNDDIVKSIQISKKIPCFCNSNLSITEILDFVVMLILQRRKTNNVYFGVQSGKTIKEPLGVK